MLRRLAPVSLAAAVWTSDINKAMKASKALRAGSVWVNCFDAGDIERTLRDGRLAPSSG